MTNKGNKAIGITAMKKSKPVMDIIFQGAVNWARENKWLK